MTFNPFEKLKNISVSCNGTLIQSPIYEPKFHIKMHRPSTANVTSTSNMTRISWKVGSPQSQFIKTFTVHIQIKQAHQSWEKVNFALPSSTWDARAYECKGNFTVSEPSEMILWQKLKGHLQVRVRIKSNQWKGGHWSEWSPTTSWVEEDEVATSQEKALNLDQPSALIFILLVLPLGLFFFVASVLVIYSCCIRKRNLKLKTVPNPSQYFCTLHSVYGGNFKKWLNPAPMSNPFFVSRPCEDICAVEVCESWDKMPPSSPSSSSALVHSPCADDPLSSCSSSCFSNMDYFMSSGTGSSTHTCTSPYFSYQGNVLSPHRKLHLSLCPLFISSSIYESLRREPQSPDSGFGIGRFEDQDTEVFHDNQSSPLLLHLPVNVSSFSPASPLYPSEVNLVFDNHGLEEDTPVAASLASEHLSDWPVIEPMCRASSLPVDTCKSGYLTLKELHTTFSNKSI
ncbi:interleukin-2 receptor subunit beta isoform X2 [Boleophthalmus pectinirostris]|uniref:interleukin-2 receptor subunit beta isoform X2 n=1 Tax=Boleophthalmus pectinirostris TaxID=150288 RepID=UPI00242E00AD|nr:interleukin-2 receptor subunit beta isoform X2 [Boleophthalmus pectinirostris]